MMISRENIKERANMYRLLSRVFAREADETLLEKLDGMSFPKAKGLLGAGYEMLKSYLASRGDNAVEELAVDYAGAFLAAGKADGAAAIPVQSLYGPERLFMQESWESARGWYARYGLGSADEDMMDDHLATELEFMAYLCGNADVTEQKAFLEEHLINWLPAFFADLEKFAKTDFYKAAGKMALGFVTMEKELLEAMVSGEVLTSKSFSVRNERFANILARLQESYHVYAPMRFPKRGPKGRDLIRYGEIGRLEDIVYKEKSHFSPKECFYPVSQTLFRFDGEECSEEPMADDKGIIIICRACDINAIKHLDNIFLRNGESDSYYARMREKIKLILLECRESFDNCFCASMGSNVAGGYSAAMRIDDICALMEICDEELLSYFLDEVPIDFAPEFVKENPRKANLPRIERSRMKEICAMDYWKKFDDECIACGGCNTVCPGCCCFDTVDIIYDEQSLSGERRRVWSGCMLRNFTETAGGGMARKTQGANMRFKVLHKIFDYGLRFDDGPMCAGCGRCIDRCPKGIDFLDTINEFADALGKEEA